MCLKFAGAGATDLRGVQSEILIPCAHINARNIGCIKDEELSIFHVRPSNADLEPLLNRISTGRSSN